MLVHADDQDLTVTAGFEGKASLAAGEKIVLTLSRPLPSREGRLALVIGPTDLTALASIDENSISYDPSVLPLPVGETEATIYLITPDNEWKQIASFPLRIETAATAEPSEGKSLPSDQQNIAGQQPVDSERRWGFDKATLTPSVTIGMKSQLAEKAFPQENASARSTYNDFTLQGSLQTEFARGAFNSQSQFDIAGSSFRQEALRFAEKGNTAPRIDLASYLLQFQAGKARVQAGHVAFGTNRHLINSFSSRGITVTLPVTSHSDLSVAAMNGTSIVGWDNFFGLNRRKHQIVSGAFGYEFIPQRPGGLRVETGIMHGSLLPLNNFNQGVINDAEQSKGLSLRIAASDGAGRFRLDGGFARSRFNNPSDPLLDQGLNLVAVRENSRNARYLDASYSILQDFALSSTRKASLAFNYRHERVDPLFRSVAAFTQADRFQNQFELVGVIGEINATYVYGRFNDNLDDIPSILKTLTRRNGLILGVPLVSLFGDPANPSPWLPRLSYNFDRTHQFGAAFPINSGFDSASQVPDQLSNNQGFVAEWQAQRWRFGYRFNRSFQDNRQPGRELADLRNLINGFTFGFTPVASFDLNLDLTRESADNREQARIDHTNRIGANINWRLWQSMALTATISTTFAGDVAETSRSRNAELDLQWSYRFGLEKSRYRKFSGQFFIRYANRYASSRDNLFGFNNLTKTQTLNTGLSFTFF
ncbi:MAG: hypothetical protein L0229_09370 [Blastocatellia bacterium]|nr:hypothetical protein [Blastocatellia bacterium]